MSTTDDLSAQGEPAKDRHPVWGLPARLLIDGELHVYDRYLDSWVSTLGKRELSGWTILHGMSLNTRVEVAR